MNQDQLLQTYLERVENGEPLEAVLQQIPAEEQQLAELLRTAVRTRDAARATRMDPAVAQAQDQRIREHEKSYGSPTRQNHPVRPLWPVLAGLGTAFLVFAVLAFAAVGVLLTRSAEARAATVMEVSGIVESGPADRSSDWMPLADGNQVAAGTILRTRADSSATLVFFDGSRTVLAPYSEVVLEKVGGSTSLMGKKTIAVRLQQIAGDTNNSVVPFRTDGASFEVGTPGGMVTVHGTVFDVSVDDRGIAFFTVDHGEVKVTNGGETVTLKTGQSTYSIGDGNMGEAEYSFMVQGIVSAVDGEYWTVNGVVFHVSPELAAQTIYGLGDAVFVSGHILSDGTLEAYRITYARNDKIKTNLTGVVQELSAERIVVSGVAFVIDGNTEIRDEIKVGDIVEVHFMVNEGVYIATEIHLADREDDEEGTPTPEVTATVTQTPAITTTPSVTAEPSETLTPSATIDPTLVPTMEVTPSPESSRCDNRSKQHPEGLTLAQRWNVSYEEIMGWFCQGFGFGEIDLAYELAEKSGEPVAEVFAMKSSGMGWGQIKQTLDPKAEKVKPTKEHPGKKK